MKLRVLDLFSGIGGFGLGLERCGGFQTIAFCESNSYRRGVLKKHWPAIPIHQDVRELTAKDVEANGSTVDVICGGFPCKQTSVAAAAHGRRSGLAGQDSGLFGEMVRLIGDVRPRWSIVENPMGVASWSREITRSLEGVGYTVSRSECAASDFGAPHSRRRVFFIANSDGKRLEITWPRRSPETNSSSWRASPGNLWRKTKPRTWRMDDGVSNRMDRLQALGDSVMPQAIEVIGRHILESESIK